VPQHSSSEKDLPVSLFASACFWSVSFFIAILEAVHCLCLCSKLLTKPNLIQEYLLIGMLPESVNSC